MKVYNVYDDVDGTNKWFPSRNEALKFARSEAAEAPARTTYWITMYDLGASIDKRIVCRCLEGEGFAEKIETVAEIKGKLKDEDDE